MCVATTPKHVCPNYWETTILKKGRKISLIKEWEKFDFEDPWDSLIELVKKKKKKYKELKGAPTTSFTTTSSQSE